MTLYNKFRPVSFDDVLGNNAMINALKKALQKKNHSHVYLLAGPPGTGKTTIARIMAKMVGAEEMDVREINSANNRGIDTAREIIQSCRLMPMSGNAIAFIIDEVHKTTADWQNAMLKVLEDTPEHVYFFLCTTDPQKLIAAVKSRCTLIKTEPLQEESLTQILSRVIKAENINIKNKMVLKIAEAAEGSGRKALVLLERIANAEPDEIDTILESSGVIENDPEIIELPRTLLNPRCTWNDIAKILKKLKDTGKLEDAETVRYIVLGYMNSVMLSGKMNPRAATIMEAFSDNTFNTGKFGITLACLNVIA